MKTKEEILEHLKTAMYNQSARSCIYGWLIGVKICSPGNLPHIESLGSKDGAHVFDDFLAWVDEPNLEVGDYVHVVVPNLGEDWHSMVTGIHKDIDGWRFNTCHPNHSDVSYPIRYATKESKEDAMEDKEPIGNVGKDNRFMFGKSIDGSFKFSPLNGLNESHPFLEEYVSLLGHSFLNKSETESACKAGYIVLYNNEEYYIIAESVKELVDELCFFKGEDKVASFPPKTPWIKI